MPTLRLTRANEDVDSFLSVLGGLRETRLTAVLGYLMTRFPNEFGALLGFTPSPLDRVSVEETDEGDRYDVLVRQSGSIHLIEGKLGMEQRLDQLLRYIQSKRRQHGVRPSLTVVDDGSEAAQSRLRAFEPIRKQVCSLRFVTWADVAKVCQDILRRKRSLIQDRTGTVIAKEFLLHLQDHHMTHERHPEIYLRDVGTKDSVELYFRHSIYKCQASFINSARHNLYFAPYFTRQMADAIRQTNLVPVGEGISFVSQVESVLVIDTKGVQDYLKELKHPTYKEAADLIRKNHREKQVLLMRLGTPRLMFASPVTKHKLNRQGGFGLGAMGSRSITFDRLLEAAQA
jgi:hypothetical protein